MSVHVRKNLGLTIIITLILITGIAMFARNLRADTAILAGDDNFTTGNGSQLTISFPANYFGTGSEAIAATSYTMVSNSFPDTVVHRNSDITTFPGTTNLSLSKLDLKSNGYVVVHYGPSGPTEYWTMKATQDTSNSAAGTLTLNSDGTGSSTLNINYVLTLEGNGKVRTKNGSINFDTVGMTWSGSGSTPIIRATSGHHAPDHDHVVTPPPG